jgi:hypothetical protein
VKILRNSKSLQGEKTKMSNFDKEQQHSSLVGLDLSCCQFLGAEFYLALNYLHSHGVNFKGFVTFQFLQSF